MKTVFSTLSMLLALATFGQTLSPDQLNEDFAIFKNSIKEIHPGLYWYATEEEIESRFNKIENQLKQEMELKEYYGLLQKFYAGIRCGHSWMSMPWAWRKIVDEGPYRIPVDFYLEKNRMVTFRDLTDDQSIERGNELVSINGIEVQNLLDSLTQYVPTDGYSKGRQIRILSSNFSRYFQVHFGMDSLFVLELKSGNEIFEISLKGLKNEEANKRSKERYRIIDYAKQMLEFKAINDVAYLKIQSFDKEDIKGGNQKYKSFLKETFKSIDEQKISKLIIDLRGNGGGEDNYGATLAKYLLDEPFDYYERMEAVTNKFNFNNYSYQRGFNTMGKLLKKDRDKPGTFTYNLSRQVKKQKPVKNPFEGEVIVLIDGGTFSAASEIAAILHTNKRAKFLGDETGGGYYGNNSAMMYGIQLPNSRINYYLPIIRYYVAVDHPPFEGRGLIPEIEMPRTFEDYLSEEDEVLQKAIELLEMGN